MTHGTNPDAIRYLSKAQVAERFGVTPRTVHSWITSGLLPAVRVGPHLIRVNAVDVDKLVRPRTPGRSARR